MSRICGARRLTMTLALAVGLPAASLTAVALTTTLATASPAAASPVARAAAARPDVAHPAAAPNQGLSATPESMYQTNNTVTAVTVSNGVVYAGGQFTTVRPPGGSTGAVTRTYLTAFSASTGAVTSFDPALNGAVDAVAVSPNGATLYVGGSFTTVNGQTRNRFAAFSIATGTLIGWNPNATGIGYAITATATSVYLGGTFGKIGGVAHTDLAAVDPVTGALQTAFTATAGGQVLSIADVPGVNRLLVAGDFNTLAGVADHAFGSVDPTTGGYQDFGTSGTLPNTAFCTADGEDIIVSGSVAYVAGDGIQPGCFDGDFATSVTDGSLIWINPCEGSTTSLAMINGVLYKGSHMHDCSYNAGGALGGFTGAFAQGQRKFYRLAAQNPADGSFEHWFPNTNAGGSTHVGPLAMATDGTQLFVTGDFTQVNGKAQQGITRFGPGPSAAPTKPTVAPTATVSGPASATVTVPGVLDMDSGVLTYTLYRGATVVGTQTAESWPWTQPTLRFVDTGVTTGTAYTYKYTVSDGTSTTAYSPASASVTPTAAGAPAGYDPTVTAQAPSMWWQFNGSAADTSGSGANGAFQGTAAAAATGPVSGDGAVTLDGSTGYVASAAAQTPSATFTESLWVNTSTVSGGVLMAFDSNQTGLGGQVDRAIWMDDDGQLVFGMQSPRPPPPAFGMPSTVVRSAGSYNDGKWHLVTASFNGTTMSLYVDGVLVGSTPETQILPGSGYWRVGFDDLSSYNHVFGTNSTGDTAPNSYFLNGSAAEVATYPSALTAAQVGQLWAAGGPGAIGVSGG